MSYRYFAVQGLRGGAWHTLFAPYITQDDASAKALTLKSVNPACTYRVVEIEAHHQ